MHINSIDKVIEVLGGYKQASKLAGAVPHASLNWRSRGALPKYTFPALQAELARKGHTAPLSLWGMELRPRPRRRLNGGAR